MSNVTLRIGGRDYTMACAEGEEAHVASLGRMIEEKVQSMGTAAQSEPRQLLFAALLLADELHEARERLAAAPSPTSQADLLEALAARLETCAAALEA